MNQQINLYLPEFRVKKDPLSAVLLGQIVAGVAVLLLLVSAYNYFQQWRLGNELESLRATLQEETRRTSELENQLAGRSGNQGLQQRLDTAEARLEASRQIRDFLNNTQLGNVDGFSEYFKDIARASVEGLSISEFTFRDGGAAVSMNGQVEDSVLVPRYVANLEASGSSLRNLRFSPTISRPGPEDQVFSFSLSTASDE